jgi:hypothetical protein
MEHHTGADATGVYETGPDETGADGASADETGETRAPATGQPRVDAALRLLDRLPGLPVSDHPELFEQVHAQLSEVLGELDSGAAGPADVAGG